MIKPTSDEFKEYTMDGKTMRVPTFGITPTIIDFTLSRMKDPKSNVEIFLDMALDEEMFMSKGDYQFDIYRMMRDANRLVFVVLLLHLVYTGVLIFKICCTWKE